MIVSHKHRFIFIHCRKVAGSSMKVVLAPHLGEADLVIASLHEILDSGVQLPAATEAILHTPRARAIALGAWAVYRRSWPEAQNIALKRHFNGPLGPNPPHPSAAQARDFTGGAWDSYTKWCFVRNPYERLASDYGWRRRKTGKEMTFREFLEARRSGDDTTGLIHLGATSNWEMMTIDDQIVVDEIGRYENLQADFTRIMTRLGLPDIALDVNAKASQVPRDTYASLYGSAERDLVAEICAPELEYFGYEFPY